MSKIKDKKFNKKFLKLIFKKLLNFLFQIECRLAKAWVSSAYSRLFYSQWGLGPTPEWFDHEIDIFYQWSKTNNSLWLERGVFGSLTLKGGNLLELCCGDGFNSKYFYSYRSKNIIACDFDQSAILTAKKKNYSTNIQFVIADIRKKMPEGKYENIIWDAAIEHFTANEIKHIMGNIKNRLTNNGILSGYTIVERKDGVKSHQDHEYEFKDMEDLKIFLTPHFKNVKVFETIYPSRHNLYFWCSNDILPFTKKWIHGI